jgi:hypothetical protein
MRKLFLILGLLSVLLFIINVRAQVEVDIDPESTIKNVFVDTFGFPEEWMNIRDMIFYGLIPFLGIFVIVYGFLDRIRIFRKNKINGFLSFLIAFSTLPMRLFILIVATLFALMGVYSVAIFAVIFMIGVFLFSRARIWTWKNEYGHYDMARAGVDNQIRLLDDRIRKINGQIERIRNDQNIDSMDPQWVSHIDDLESEKRKWENRKHLLEIKKQHISDQKEAARSFADLE